MLNAYKIPKIHEINNVKELRLVKQVL